MRKKQFIALANAIIANRAAFTPEAIEILADFCKEQNYLFDRQRWLAYIAGECGPNGGAIKNK